MSTLELKELSHPAGEVIKIAAGKTLDLKTQGSVTMPTGGIIQVVNGSTSTQVISTATQTYVDTGITATITPTSASSKIIVVVNIVGIWRDAGNTWNRMGIKILRGSTVVSESLAQNWSQDTFAQRLAGALYTVYDSPNSTSALTYKVQFQSEVLSSAAGLAVQKDSNNGPSNIFLYEVSA
tara:strand:- start:605 stop:1147 length:543 start_codon:yes stop_codon:yes gene_type:complete